ncbi:hypothetical protein [Synoicihabitans lomoniglobus]|uniref:Primosomal protein N' (Replication factor Y)-superfamily II helicase n=1 Tax=Synoicihabitans lomoniglobus TaxID=2909285 RepID=A0AAE9ZXX6_9BACT|nr:hypothetical protein [Opitutaceae bacterium LMO-M01]WED65005.1 hypothetical protein PXH66_21870 [Opitutaceae bacterium LMO-M01]
MAAEKSAEVGAHEFACVQCGADVSYEIGLSALQCPYCGTQNEIPVMADAVGEQDFRAVLAAGESAAGTYDVSTAKCVSCGAESTLDPNISHDSCAFCGVPVEAEAQSRRLIQPQALLPFAVPRDDARQSFKAWLASRWFAPNTLKRMGQLDGGLQGVFLPHWTYDTDCSTSYVGQRGIYYWVTEHYTTTDANGKSVRKSRQVRKTRWYPASGRVLNRFDDLLVAASHSLPTKYVEALEPWGLPELVAADRAYMAGFKTESYSVDLESGFAAAEQQMTGPIQQTIRADIGGDTQRILDYRVTYRDITFKHILLPVWISTYRFKERVFRIMVNARTGEVQGERPWSWLKITVTALVGIALVAVIAWAANQS